MESIRTGEKTAQKTVQSLGVCPPSQLESVKKFAQDLIIRLKDERHPALPGMAEVVYSQESPKKTYSELL